MVKMWFFNYRNEIPVPKFPNFVLFRCDYKLLSSKLSQFFWVYRRAEDFASIILFAIVVLYLNRGVNNFEKRCTEFGIFGIFWFFGILIFRIFWDLSEFFGIFWDFWDFWDFLGFFRIFGIFEIYGIF